MSVKDSMLILMVGCPSSGKTTTCNIIKSGYKNPDDIVIIGRDYLRMMNHALNRDSLNSYFDDSTHHKEREISRLQNDIIRENLLAGKIVLVDDTNLDYNILKNTISKYYYTSIVLVFHHVDSKTLYERNNMSIDFISEDKMRSFIDKFKFISSKKDVLDKMLTELQIRKQPIILDSNKPKSVIFDIDGTLAINKDNNRDYFDMSRVKEDLLNVGVYESLLAHHNSGHKIIICSGRDSSAFELTVEWFDDNNIPYDEMYFRPEGCFDTDYIVKDDMWRMLSDKYNIICMYDDRNQVVDHARLIGLNCFQVNYGNK